MNPRALLRTALLSTALPSITLLSTALCGWGCSRSTEPAASALPSSPPAPVDAGSLEAPDVSRPAPDTAPPAASDAARLAPGAAPERRSTCRRARAPVPDVEPSAARLPAPALADALGNRDGALTGIERDVSKSLEALPVGTRCWLGVEWTHAGGPTIPLEGLLDVACGLDCGDDHRGLAPTDAPLFDRACSAAVAIVAQADGFAPRGFMALGDRPFLFDTDGEVGSPTAVLPPIAAIADQLAAAEPACADAIRRAAQRWTSALARGGCLAERLGDFAGLGDYHTDPPRCGWPLATLHFAGARRCAAGDRERARLLFTLFATGDILTPVRPVEVPVDELIGAGLPGRPFDPTRVIEWGRRLGDPGALDPRDRVALIGALVTVPLGLADAEIDALLAGGVDPRRVDEPLLVHLARRGRLHALPEGVRPLSPRARAALRARIEPGCLERIETRTSGGTDER